MLQIRHLTITHKESLRKLTDDLSFVINRGDKTVLIGEEGNGKSTLLKWIYDPRLIAGYAEAEGTRVSQGETLAYLPQELPAEAREQSVFEYFSERAGFADASPRELAALEAQLGLPEGTCCGAQRMGTLSGGEKVKIQLAALLLARPDVLLLDEPSNDVDLETLAWLEALIRSCPQSVLFISHDETLIERTADHVILLEQLRRKSESRHTVAALPYRQFVQERAALFQKQAQRAGSERREEAKAMEKFRRIRQRVEFEQETISRGDPAGGRLLKKKMASVKAMERRYAREHAEMTADPESEDAILIRQHGAARVPPNKTVLDLRVPELRCPGGDRRVLAENVSLRVRGAEKICIVGRNGAGKTTLLRAIRDALNARNDLRVFYVPQDHDELLRPDETPVAFLAPDGTKDAVTEARTYLGSLRFTAEEMLRPIRTLSGGQRAKLLLLKMSLSDADVLLLDEPTRNLSPLSGPEIRALLRGFPGAIISVSHDRKFIAEVCSRAYRLTQSGLAPIETAD